MEQFCCAVCSVAHRVLVEADDALNAGRETPHSHSDAAGGTKVTWLPRPVAWIRLAQTRSVSDSLGTATAGRNMRGAAGNPLIRCNFWSRVGERLATLHTRQDAAG